MGKAFKFGNNIDTDQIIPGKYLVIQDPKELAKHVMEGADPDFAKKMREGDIIVAGKNFGCGSSREHAPMALKQSGIKCVVAESFARIFYRNSINIGFPILELKEASNLIEEGDILEIDLNKGEIRNISRNEVYHANPIPKFIIDIIESGGLLEYIKKMRD
ncbi:MAG: 3-isopropylmalate dehydratase small subunit [Candidatus Hydrothermarchaeota archaeon]